MEKPENKQRLEAQENNKNELSLQWHLNRARELFKPMEKSDEYKKSLMENDFDVSIREIQNYWTNRAGYNIYVAVLPCKIRKLPHLV